MLTRVTEWLKKINKSAFASGVLVLVAPVVLYFILQDMEDSKLSKDKINIAEMLSGCYTFASAFLLWINLSEQRKQNEKQSTEFKTQLDLQREQNKKASIENHFYKMLEIARENSNNISSKGKIGREVFSRINNEFEDLYNIILPILGKNFKKTNLLIIQITWILLFYGMDSKMKLARDAEIRKILSAELPNEQEQQLIIKSIDEEKLYKKRYCCAFIGYLKYDGYQSILAHYYRHLYQVVTYINEQDILNYNEKYHYIKTLRAQLNVFELILLFYNTLSPYGKTWELNLCDKNILGNVDEYITKMGNSINNQLITKYQFFRNATMPLLSGEMKIRISDFYPMINYENATDAKCGINKQDRDKLDEIYRK